MLELLQAHEKEVYKQTTERERKVKENDVELEKLWVNDLIRQCEFE